MPKEDKLKRILELNAKIIKLGGRSNAIGTLKGSSICLIKHTFQGAYVYIVCRKYP